MPSQNNSKPELIYFSPWNPNFEDVSHIGINTQTNPQTVFRVYYRGLVHNHLPNNLKVIPIEQARDTYHLRPGTLKEKIELGLVDID